MSSMYNNILKHHELRELAFSTVDFPRNKSLLIHCLINLSHTRWIDVENYAACILHWHPDFFPSRSEFNSYFEDESDTLKLAGKHIYDQLDSVADEVLPPGEHPEYITTVHNGVKYILNGSVGSGQENEIEEGVQYSFIMEKDKWYSSPAYFRYGKFEEDKSLSIIGFLDKLNENPNLKFRLFRMQQDVDGDSDSYCLAVKANLPTLVIASPFVDVEENTGHHIVTLTSQEMLDALVKMGVGL